jgi:hypothetical protein
MDVNVTLWGSKRSIGDREVIVDQQCNWLKLGSVAPLVGFFSYSKSFWRVYIEQDNYKACTEVALLYLYFFHASVDLGLIGPGVKPNADLGADRENCQLSFRYSSDWMRRVNGGY